MVYLAFIFALALACLAGMEFVFLMTVETKNRQLKQRLERLENENARLQECLSEAQSQIEHNASDADEVWPELIDDNPTH
jgi:predicted nuclease with TOPRIM domain